MSRHFGDPTTAATTALAPVEELQLVQTDAIADVRAGLPVRAAITVRPADSIDRDRVVGHGVTSHVRSVSVTAVLPVPLLAGSFYLLVFDRAALDLVPTLARCDRVLMLDEGEFEVRWRFLQPVVLAAAGEPQP
ncbi:MAG: hypothetical protein IPK26_30580 [Planctomycetes bacterium]|nr:hypothetical protein [Planctomycetota bacterium]